MSADLNPLNTGWSWLRALIVAALLSLLGMTAATAQTSAGTQLQPVPELTGRVIDKSGTLSSNDVQSLSTQLEKLETDTGAQLVVLMVPTTAPEDIAAYAWRVASSWKLGRKDIGDGSLIVVAKNDRRMRIEVARKLEGAIPDIQASRIIDGAMKPRFRADDYAGGLSAAIDQMSLLIHGEKLPAPQAKPASRNWTQHLDTLLPLLLLGFPIAIAVARSIFGRFLGSLVVGGGVGFVAYLVTTSLLIAGFAAFIGLIFTLLSNLSRGSSSGPYIGGGGSSSGGGWSSGGGGGGSWSSGGGGFSSGGGGSFGGGGASGDW